MLTRILSAPSHNIWLLIPWNIPKSLHKKGLKMRHISSVDSLACFPSDLHCWLHCFTSDSGSLSAQIAPAAWTRFKCYLNIYVLITSVQSWLLRTKVFYHFHKHLWKAQSREVEILCIIWSFLFNFWWSTSTKRNGKKEKCFNLEILLSDSVNRFFCLFVFFLGFLPVLMKNNRK